MKGRELGSDLLSSFFQPSLKWAEETVCARYTVWCSVPISQEIIAGYITTFTSNGLIRKVYVPFSVLLNQFANILVRTLYLCSLEILVYNFLILFLSGLGMRAMLAL